MRPALCLLALLGAGSPNQPSFSVELVGQHCDASPVVLRLELGAASGSLRWGTGNGAAFDELAVHSLAEDRWRIEFRYDACQAGPPATALWSPCHGGGSWYVHGEAMLVRRGDHVSAFGLANVDTVDTPFRVEGELGR